MLKRFKGFWNQYSKSKRGLLGIGIIIIYGVVAVIAPLLSPLDPMTPLMSGYYPSGQQPKECEKLCVPIWYKSILGMTDLSENMIVMEDHELKTAEIFDKWKSTISHPQYVSMVYSDTVGSHDDDGGIQISYKRAASEEAPAGGSVSVTLAYDFEYPYQNPPKSIWWHHSYRIENRTPVSVAFPLKAEIRFWKGTELDPFPVKTKRISMTNAGGKYYHVGDTTVETGDVEIGIFTGSGNYTVEWVISLTDPGTGDIDLTVSVDNLATILYGESYGLLGTSSIPRPSPRDLFTMLLYGTRISFTIGLLTAIFSVLIGLFVGLVSGYVRGLVDEGLMRFADFLMVLPGLPLLIVLVTVLGPSIWNIIGILIFMGWMGFSRSVRSMVLSIRERPFIESAKASGGSTGYIIYRHILPNVFALVYISLATSVPGAIISEASLAWLGLGDITIPSWGIMLYDFSQTQTAVVKGLGEYWFWVIPPGIAIATMAMAFILMGFALDEILNPKLRKRR
jgi:ABC-type dipeptide/oligopeptide/nickel transport system permease subunit